MHEQIVGAALAVAATDDRILAADRRQAEHDFAGLRQRIAEIEGDELDLQELDQLVQSYEDEAQAARARAFRAEADRDFWRDNSRTFDCAKTSGRSIPTQ